jgi:hypothetical protein
MATNSDAVHGAMPMVIAPWTYFMELEDRTGDTTSTPESLMQWAMQDAAHRVEITKHLVVLDVIPNKSGSGSSHVVDGDADGDIVIDGVSATDLTKYDDVRLDYCAYCVQERGCARWQALTSPEVECDHGDGRVTFFYRCARGHAWQS